MPGSQGIMTGVEYRGYNGTVGVDADHLTITHSGMPARVSGLECDRPRRIPLQAVSGSAFKDATRLTNGWLTIGLRGEAPAEVGATAASNPETVMFRHKDRDRFRSLHHWLLTVVAQNQSLDIDASTIEVEHAGPTRLERLQEKQGQRDVKADEVRGALERQQEQARQARQTKETKATDEERARAAKRQTEADELRGELERRQEQARQAKEARATEKKRARAAKRQAKADRAAAVLNRYGRQVANHTFGMRTVRIYDKGYVRVSMFGVGGDFQQLLSIEASSDVSKKSGLGRGAVAIVTAGVNLAGSNKRGDVYLTIVTKGTTHVLHEDPPTVMNLRASKSLEAAGRAVIQANADRTTEETQQSTSALPSTWAEPVSASAEGVGAQKLRELAELRDQGLVTEEEFAELRAKLLRERF